MAVHKVPQDVEAEDKLIGPLSFRQFIYAMIAVGAAFVGFLLFRLTPPLVIIPLPVVVLFGVLALPLRKDQPMEIYVLALIRFFIRPRLRLWIPDGITSFIEIDTQKKDSTPLVHSLTSEVAERRLAYLSEIMDSRGWSFKHVTKPNGANVAQEYANEAATATDILDEHAALAQSFDKLLVKKSEEQRKITLATMRQAAVPSPEPAESSLQAPTQMNPQPQPTATTATPTALQSRVRYNPYPTIHQKIVQPIGDQPSTSATPQPEPESTPAPQPSANAPAANTSAMTAPVSPGIMRLAHNDDLSISAIAREAHRLEGMEDGGEVVVSLH